MYNYSCNDPCCPACSQCMPTCCCDPCRICRPCPPCPPEPSYYAVIYDANGGSGGLADVNLSQGAAYTIKSSEEVGISWTGHIFLSWNTSPDGTGTSYRPGDVITVTHSLTLYAQWLTVPTETADVIYDPNGGIGGLTDYGIPVGSSYTLRSAVDVNMYRTGYTFLGWNTQPDGSGTFYQPGDVATIRGNQTFYAIWQRNTFTVTYHPGIGGMGSLHMDTVAEGDSYTILSDVTVGFTRLNYEFAGWNTAIDGTGTLYSSGDVMNITKDTTLYAQWRPVAVGDVFYRNDLVI